MKNIVSKTAFKTILAIIIFLVAAFTVASLGFPQHMATLFENLGNYSFATGYASLAYTYSGTYENLARCVDDSILAGDDGNIVNFASRMVDNKGFEEYCLKRDEETKNNLGKYGVSATTDFSYKQYLMGNLACSQYALGDKDAAIETAENAMKGLSFPANNVYVMLTRRAYAANDKEMKDKLYEIISNLEVAFEEENYRSAVLQILR